MEDFSLSHPDAIPALKKWVDFVEKADWKNHNDLKNDYRSADMVGCNHYVFNIKGNKYRLIVVVVFFAGTVDIRFVGTHDEYSKIGPNKIKTI